MKILINIIFFMFMLSMPLFALRSGGRSGGRGFSGRSGYHSSGHSGGVGGTHVISGSGHGLHSGVEYGNVVPAKNSKYDILVVVGIILLIIISIVIFIITKNRKIKKSKEIIGKISEIDETWDTEYIKTRVEEVFFKLVESKLNRTADIKELTSASFYRNFKAKIDGMLIRNEKYIIENIEIKEIQVVEVTDYKDDTQDRFWVYLVVNMVHFLVDSNNIIIEGFQKPEDYKELWNFMRGSDNSWILREILDEPEEHMHKFKSFSEEL